MTRSVIIILALLTILKNKSSAQITPLEKEILIYQIDSLQTCYKIYLTKNTDSYFSTDISIINGVKKEIKSKTNYIHKTGFSEKIVLTKIDKRKILKGLEGCKKNTWSNKIMFSDRIIIIDTISIFKIIDSTCLNRLVAEKKMVNVLSLSRPIFIEKGHSFVIYKMVKQFDPKRRAFYSAHYEFTLYNMTWDNKWTKVGELISGIMCSG